MIDELCKHDLVVGTCSLCSGTEQVQRGRDDTSECRSCGAEVLWVVTEKDKKMPLDVDPSDDGTFVKLRREPNGDKVVGFVKTADREAETRPRYTSHFATCPDADLHRQR